MKKITVLLLVLALTGCSSLVGMVPSFWDDNQSARIIDVRQKVEQIDCDEAQAPQVEKIAREIRWFELYSNSKGSRQADVVRIVKPMQATVIAWQQRGEGSKSYCELKKKVLIAEAERAAAAILGRF